ncbi:DNA polymerase III subunit alpha domain protein [Clostridium botulinum 202F]|nr:DNA polymerase III subunit alpha domain protein [Clostridium botulinum 202F]
MMSTKNEIGVADNEKKDFVHLHLHTGYSL